MFVGIVVQLAQLDEMVDVAEPVAMVNGVLQDQWVLRVSQAPLGQLDCQGRKATEEDLAVPVKRDSLDMMAFKVKKDLQDYMVPLVRWGLEVSLA